VKECSGGLVISATTTPTTITLTCFSI